MKIQAFYTKEVVAAEPTESLSEAVIRMAENRIGSLVITQGSQLVGILTERDILRAIADGREPKATPVAEYMTPDPATAGLDEDSERVVERMLKLAIRHMPIIDDGRLAGIVSARDVLMLEAWPPSDYRRRLLESAQPLTSGRPGVA